MKVTFEEVSSNCKTDVVTLQTALPMTGPMINEALANAKTVPLLEEIKEEAKEKYSTLRRLAIFEIIFGITWTIMGIFFYSPHTCNHSDPLYFLPYLVPWMVSGTGVITMVKGYVSLSQHFKGSSSSRILTCLNLHNHIFAITITASMAKLITSLAIARSVEHFFCGDGILRMQPAWLITYSLNLVFMILVAWSALLQRSSPTNFYKNGLSHLKLRLSRKNARPSYLEIIGVQEYFDDEDDVDPIWIKQDSPVVKEHLPKHDDDINQLEEENLIDFKQETVQEAPTNKIDADEKAPTYQQSLTADHTNEGKPPK